MTFVSKVALGQSNTEPVVHNVRLDRVYVHLSRLVKFPDELHFATQIQEAIPPKAGDDPGQPPLAVFYVTSPHPKAGSKPYPAGHLLFSVAAMPLSQWHEADKEFRHFAKLSDPLRPIFAGLVRKHLAARMSMEELDG